jgi:hypothetical protein
MDSQTALAAEAHAVEGQCLKEQLNTERLYMFQAAT